eukprot:TRINITY_DN13547_c0_g1_i1.p1 TRINITY_DN13547_c0_g1~~TRINITY_DN13547_c0_g1_i1.p1  ORF type:complete len:617 (+),score=173.71 TRINITY_DN13547_c0_g1_i1:162-2012(+)
MAKKKAAFGLSHAACAFAAFCALVAAAASTASLVMAWWAGKDAGELVNVTSHLPVDSAITIWSFELTVRVDQEDGEAKNEPMSAAWDAHCEQYELQVTWMQGRCFQIRLMRAAGILSIIFALFAVGGWIVAIMSSPLLAVIGAFLSTVAGLFSLLKMVIAAMIGTSGLSMGGVAALAAVLINLFAVFVSLYGASKEVKAEAEKEEPKNYTRQAKAAECREAAFKSHEALSNAAKRARDDDEDGGLFDEEEAVVEKKVPVYLKKVLFWSAENEGDDDEIPVELLEVAFREIDGDGSGCIELEEFVEALHRCDLPVSSEATNTVMKEIDKNASGDVDIHEFVEFFRHIEDLNRFGKRSAARAQFATFLLNCCFLTDIVVVGTLLMLFIRMEADPSSDNYIIMQNGLMVCSIALVVLFVCVVALPAARLTFGPLIAAIRKHYAPKPRWKKERKVEEEAAQVEWQPPLQPAAVHPEMIAKSWRNAGRVNQMIDTGYSVHQLRENEKAAANRRRASRMSGASQVTDGSAAMSPPGYNPQSPSGGGAKMKIDEKTGEVAAYDPNQFAVTQLQFMSMRPQTTFSALQMRTEIDTALFDASRTGSAFHASTSAYEPQPQLALTR